MKYIATICRILTGLVFMFSGFVKGVDPLGTAYRFEDYFIAYQWDFLIPYALFFSISLCTLEFILGFMLFFNLRMKLASWLVLLLMAFFTVVTFYDALYNPVPDCGCFGDAIKLTNWQTFYKNLVIIVLAILIFLYRNRFRSLIKLTPQWLLVWVVVFLFAGFSIYCYRHLPVIDFTEWKVGNKLFAENPKPVNYYLTYKNIRTGESKEYLSPDYPYDDSAWMAEHEFVSQQVEDPNTYFGKDLIITDTLQSPVTESIIRNPGLQLVINAYSLPLTRKDAFREISEFCRLAGEKGIPAAVLTSAEPEEISAFIKENQLSLDFYLADDVILKTMVRSNPGIMLLKGGVIIDKWHWRDLPDFKAFEKQYIRE